MRTLTYFEAYKHCLNETYILEEEAEHFRALGYENELHENMKQREKRFRLLEKLNNKIVDLLEDKA